MMSALLDLFRRAPPHLRGRVPVECGVGTVASHITAPLKTQEEWDAHWAATHWVDGDVATAEAMLEKANALAERRGAVGWALRESLKGSCRPAPAENARRYTQEESTW
jgi:hypothetical protein